MRALVLLVPLAVCVAVSWVAVELVQGCGYGESACTLILGGATIGVIFGSYGLFVLVARWAA